MAAAQERDFYAEARLLIRNVNAGTLATAESGVPHAALVTVAFDAETAPILLLSQLAIHTRQLQANPACALLLTEQTEAGSNPQTAARLCLTGTAAKTENLTARAIFLKCHPYAALYADFADFAFWRIFITDAYYIGGFGAARKLEVAKLSTAQ